ncbi:hypothetical protein BD410DRAFT_880373 [Rickenella mellea]|uniref:Uncharacterized protein n=1 Tax=Rickenella mellea TaxID=50990 RepID=A0A4Y7PTL3_9AGAM|nr:hypothetical protein BD410DRAFT_880373 [Rickenella mellea]
MPTVDELKADAKTNLDDVKNSCLTPMTNKTFCGIGFSSTLLKKYEDEYSLLKKKKEEADKDSTGKETKTNLYKDVIKASESLKKTLDGEINKALYNEIKDTYPKCKTCMADINTDNAKTRLMEQVRTQFSSDIKE